MLRELPALDCLCAAALRGEAAVWPGQGQALEEGPAERGAIHRRLHFHGIAGLLHERCALLEDWPSDVLADLREESLARAMWEMRHKLLMAELIEALHVAGVRSVVLKGTAYAYGLYETPAQRIRGDTDLLVAEDDLPAARSVLGGLDWERSAGDPGPFGPMHYQEIWQYRDPAGLTHDIDLHWEVTNSRALRSVLDAARMLAEARPLSRLAPHALCAEPITALIHRAVNRAEHTKSGYYSLDRYEYDPDRLIWAVDLDLLARKLTPQEWQTLAKGATSSGIAAIVHDALRFARNSIGTPIPNAVLDVLAAGPLDTPARRFLTSHGEMGRTLANLKATQGIRARATFLLARAFPSALHMRAKYPDISGSPLWALHVRRLGEVTARILRGGGA